jgi:transcriptional regulator with GAF, ATPase, and Fis domain
MQPCAKGSFTGAIKDRAGRFEAADGGTLFLDEVGEIPPELQSKLLRVLQEKQYERVGEETTRTVNVRILAASNRDLKTEVAAGRFRRDLYYRLNVFAIEVAPLRQHKEDIPLLAAHFLGQTARRLKVPLPKLTQAHLVQLHNYDWPGNVREMQNLIERALILAQRGPLRFDLPPAQVEAPMPEPRQGSESTGSEVQNSHGPRVPPARTRQPSGRAEQMRLENSRPGRRRRDAQHQPQHAGFPHQEAGTEQAGVRNAVADGGSLDRTRAGLFSTYSWKPGKKSSFIRASASRWAHLPVGGEFAGLPESFQARSCGCKYLDVFRPVG